MTILTQPTHSLPPQGRRPQPGSVANRGERPGAHRAGAGVDPIRVLRRYLWVIIASGFIGAILGTAAFFALSEFYPLYAGGVVFEVRPGLQKPSEIGGIDATSDDLVFRIAQTETYMLTSRDVLEAALRNADVQKTDWARQFYINGSFSVNDAMDDLFETLSTGVRRSTNLFTLGWTAHKPADVPVVLNAVAQAYLNTRRARDSYVYDNNLNLFNGQLDQTQRDLFDVNGEIAQLITSGGLTTLDDPRWSAQFVQMEQLTLKNTELQTSLNITNSALQLVRQQIEGRIEPNPEDLARAEMDPSLSSLQQTLRYMKSNYRSILEKFNQDGPQVVQAERDVRSAEAELDDHKRVVVLRDLQAKATELENSTTQLEAALEQNNQEMERVSKMLHELTGKASHLENLRGQREYLQEVRRSDMELIREAKLMRVRADAARVTQAQLATTPREMSFPKMEVVIPLGALAMMGLTVGLIFLREMVDQRVKSASDLSVLPGARVLGSLPDASDDPTKIIAPELVVRKQPSTVLAESYRQVATALLPQLDETESQTLLLMGGLPEAGTTTVASNLAAAASATGKSVLLIDANFRRPGLGKVMGVSDDATGLGDVLANAASLEEAIHDASEGVSIMPAGTPANRVFERLNNGLIDGVLADLRTRFDLIIFDAPPAVVAGDAMMLANKVDAAVLVVRANQEHRGLVARMISRLADARCQLIGVLLNRPRGIAGGYLKKNYAAMAEYSRNGSAS